MIFILFWKENFDDICILESFYDIYISQNFDDIYILKRKL